MKNALYIFFLLVIFTGMDCAKCTAAKENGQQKEKASTRNIEFSGLNWEVRNGFGNPGSNYWSDDSSSVWVDEAGTLHLTIRKINNTWHCTEIASVESFGYAEFRFYTIGNLNELDKNVVFGMFSYLNDKNEIDIEFTKFGVEDRSECGWFTTQPYRIEGNTENFVVNQYNDSTTHYFIWDPERIHFKSWNGHQLAANDSSLIHQWEYTGNNIPEPRNENLHINLWLYNDNTAPSDLQEVEILVKAVNIFFQPETDNRVVEIAENAPLDSVLLTLNTKGQNLAENIRYSIVSGNETDLFGITQTGELFIHKTLDYEKEQIHELVIKTMAGDLSSLSTVQLNVTNVNDNAPTAANIEIEIFSDTEVGTLLASIPAKDADGDDLFYEIKDENHAEVYFLQNDSNLHLAQALTGKVNTTDTLQIGISDGTFETIVVAIINIVSPTGVYSGLDTPKTLCRLFPNPASTVLQVEMLPNVFTSLQILDNRGVILKQLYLNTEQEKATLKIEALPKGNYLVKLSGYTKTEMLKFIKPF